MSYIPDRVHLVGSIGLNTAQDVFRTAGRLLGSRLRRIPDGEPGPRRLWVSFQYPLLRSSPYLRPDPSGALRKTSGFPLLCLREGVSSEEVEFGELGYAREARTSYVDFCAARAKGDIAPGTRFQVCLPTVMGVIYAFCTGRDIQAIEPAYERSMTAEVAAICEAIPHEDLCIQWDFCHEMIIWDGQPQDMFPLIAASKKEILARVARLSNDIPVATELGFHLCYGDFGASHFVDPKDTAPMVEVCNGIAQVVTRPIAYFHLPVPIARGDDNFFAPLTGLKLHPETELFLGVIHVKDGADGTRHRIEAAKRHVAKFGVATECGIARARTRRTIEDTLKVYAEVSQGPL